MPHKRKDYTYTVGPTRGGERYIITVRDPVARFLSAYAWSRDRLGRHGYPTADDLARDLNDDALSNVIFHRQVDWLISAERLRQPDILMILHTETLDADFERLKALIGLDDTHRLPAKGERRRNEGRYRPEDELSPLGEANVRDWYAEDYAILAEIGDTHG